MMECQHCKDLGAEFNTGPYWKSLILSDIKASATTGCAGCSIIATGIELCYRPCLDPDTAEEVVPYRMDVDLADPNDAPLTTRLGAFRGTVVCADRSRRRIRRIDEAIEFFIPEGRATCAAGNASI